MRRSASTPNVSACHGRMRPDGSGRVQVRAMTRSMSRSYQQLMAPDPPDASAPPSAAHSSSGGDGIPRAAMTIVAISVMRRSTMMRGLVRLT